MSNKRKRHDRAAPGELPANYVRRAEALNVKILWYPNSREWEVPSNVMTSAEEITEIFDAMGAADDIERVAGYLTVDGLRTPAQVDKLLRLLEGDPTVRRMPGVMHVAQRYEGVEPGVGVNEQGVFVADDHWSPDVGLPLGPDGKPGTPGDEEETP